ncbi:GNAT family N-acetyltransferase [Streptomyces sp. JNUCC 64]
MNPSPSEPLPPHSPAAGPVPSFPATAGPVPPLPATAGRGAPVALNGSASAHAVRTVLTAAFAHEPATRWICGGSTGVRDRWFAATLAAHDTLPGALRLTLDRGAEPVAAAVLTPPDGSPPGRARAAWAARAALGCGPAALVRTLRYLDAAEAAVPPGAWTLEFLGVVPEQRGRGMARRLLDHVLATLPAPAGVFLTTADPDNRALYRRFGFTTVRRLPVGPLTTTAMWHPGGTTPGP